MLVLRAIFQLIVLFVFLQGWAVGNSMLNLKDDLFVFLGTILLVVSLAFLAATTTAIWRRR
jgi:hypothetical protein